MDGAHPVMDTLTPELEPRRDLVPVTLRMPSGASPFVQSFAVAAASVLKRLADDGMGIEGHEFLLRVPVLVTGAASREAAERLAREQAAAAAGNWLVVESPA
jgi:hypothetical protein